VTASAHDTITSKSAAGVNFLAFLERKTNRKANDFCALFHEDTEPHANTHSKCTKIYVKYYFPSVFRNLYTELQDPAFKCSTAIVQLAALSPGTVRFSMCLCVKSSLNLQGNALCILEWRTWGQNTSVVGTNVSVWTTHFQCSPTSARKWVTIFFGMDYRNQVKTSLLSVPAVEWTERWGADFRRTFVVWLPVCGLQYALHHLFPRAILQSETFLGQLQLDRAPPHSSRVTQNPSWQVDLSRRSAVLSSVISRYQPTNLHLFGHMIATVQEQKSETRNLLCEEALKRSEHKPLFVLALWSRFPDMVPRTWKTGRRLPPTF
jgi:hypothetical protein